MLHPTAAEFRATCAVALARAVQTTPAPLLVSVRENYAPPVAGVRREGYLYPTYAAALGYWPEAEAGAYGALRCEGPVYYDRPDDAIAALLAEITTTQAA